MSTFLKSEKCFGILGACRELTDAEPRNPDHSCLILSKMEYYPPERRQRGLNVDFFEIRKVFLNPWGMPRNSRHGPEWSWSFLSDPVQNGILPTWDAPETCQRGLNINFLDIRKVFWNPWAILINSRCGPEWSWSFLSDPVQNGIEAVVCTREA